MIVLVGILSSVFLQFAILFHCEHFYFERWADEEYALKGGDK